MDYDAVSVEKEPAKNTKAWYAATGFLGVCLIGVTIALVVVLVTREKSNETPTTASGLSATQVGSICLSKECTLSAAYLLSNMDNKTDPCDDFYEFACGSFPQNHQLSKVQPEQVSLETLVENKLTRQISDFLDEPINKEDSASLVLAKTYYQSCITQDDQKESYALSPLNLTMQELGRWPVLFPNWTVPSNYSWENHTLAALRRSTVSLFMLKASRNIESGSIESVTISKPGFPTFFVHPVFKGPDPQVAALAFKTGWRSPQLVSYYRSLHETALKLGANYSIAQKNMHDVVDFQIEFYRMIMAENEDDDIRTLREWRTKFPTFNWDQLKSFFGSYSEITEEVDISIDGFFPGLLQLVQRTDRRIIKNVIDSAVISGIVTFLPNFERAFPSFPLWNYCSMLARGYFPDIVASAHAMKHSRPSSIFQASLMINKIKDEMKVLISNAIWLNPRTQQALLKKIETMKLNLGNPRRFLNDSYLTEPFNQIKMLPNEFYNNTIKLGQKMYQEYLLPHTKTYSDDNWKSPPFKFGANYNTNHSLTIPTIMFQLPLFDEKVPDYLNYGALGAIAGHEMGHGFSYPNLRRNGTDHFLDWEKKEYNKKTEKEDCYKNQYSKIKDPILGEYLDGNQTLDENIPDSIGLKISYKAFTKLLSEQIDFPVLPGLKQYTPKQLFFQSFAAVQCAIYSKEIRRLYSKVDSHSFPKYRVNIPLQNLPEFGEAFGCPSNSKMTPKERCEMW